MDVQTQIVTVGARILKNYRPTMAGLSGQAPASSYHMLGAYSYLIELWGSPAFDADVDGDGRVSSEENMDWIDIELTGEGWITPHEVDHPDLGKVWIGGSAKKHIGRTPPARYIEQETLKNSQFVMYCASQFPKVEVGDIDFTDLGDGLFWVDVTVKNDHTYPTASDQSKKLKRVGQDKILFNTSNNIELIPMDSKLPVIDPLSGGGRGMYSSGGRSGTSGVQPAAGKEIHTWINGNSSLTYRYLVNKKGGKGWIEVELVSERGVSMFVSRLSCW